MKKIIVILFSSNIKKKEILRIRNFVEFYFKTKSIVLKNKDFFNKKLNVKNDDIIVSLKEKNQNVHENNFKSFSKNLFFINIDEKRITIRSFDKNNQDFFKESNIFTKLQSDFSKGFFYFPYGFTYKLSGLGDLDEFGFRINNNISELRKRESKHYVIATFGGSAVWSIECLANETFTQNLEFLLNNDKDLKKKGYKFSCLNFGQSSATIFQSIIYYLLFSSDLRPEFVICHDGWNDLLYGSYTDKYLLREKNFTYSYELEEWALRINGKSSDDYKKNEILPYVNKNIPSDIISAYLFRKKQFMKIVKADNGFFINGVQPTLSDKKKLSLEEKVALNDNLINSTDSWQYIRKNMSNLLEKVIEAYTGDENFLDFKKVFSKLSPTDTHFVDNIHLTPEGDKVVANEYKKIIKRKII